MMNWRNLIRTVRSVSATVNQEVVAGDVARGI